ncbi:hypothetical protein MMC18_007933 [Xylographa bjoerkii]|nr:hypothetical protein [Xylographa bjoerkii]
MSTYSTPLRGHTSLNSDYEKSNQGSDEIGFSSPPDASTDDEKSMDSSDDAADERTCHGRPPRERYRKAYQTLLDESVTTDTHRAHHETDSLLRPSQYGLTFWSSREKENLFTSIERRGMDDLQGIAAFIGSKSEPEVHAYLELLKQATRLHHLYEPRPQPVGLFQVPAASEIGGECVVALESMADAYLRKEQQLEETREEEKHGPFWLLNVESAAQLENLDTGDTYPDLVTDNTNLRLAIKLLNLQALLELSSLVFMNSSIPEDNWRQHTQTGETPCLFATAFCDFHELVVGLTKRLMSSALFFAMSRLRCSRSSNYHHVNHVRKADVMAAVNVLGLPHDANEFWIDSARRCKLDVYEHPRAKNNTADRLSYDEVESCLRRPRSRSTSMSRVLSSHSSRKRGFDVTAVVSTDAESVENDADEISSGSSLDDMAPEFCEDVLAIDTDLDNQATSMPESSQDRQELYAEAVDREQGLQEEQKLWLILKKQIPRNTTDEPDRPFKRPRISRKSNQELIDWKASFEYKTEWEEFGVQRPGFDPAQQHRGRRRKHSIAEHRQSSTASQRSSRISEEDHGTDLCEA